MRAKTEWGKDAERPNTHAVLGRPRTQQPRRFAAADDALGHFEPGSNCVGDDVDGESKAMIGPVAAIDPVAVLLKFAFIGVLYLFLLWVARSALKDLRRPSAQAVVAEPASAVARLARSVLVVEGGGGLPPGAAYVVDGNTTIGRAPAADIQIDDPFASGR